VPARLLVSIDRSLARRAQANAAAAVRADARHAADRREAVRAMGARPDPLAVREAR
jgi:hypothetical protein